MTIKFKDGQKLAIAFDDGPPIRATIFDVPGAAPQIRIEESNDHRLVKEFPKVIHLRAG